MADFYAELPINIRVTGSYHDMGAFASDIAKLSRIVMLNDVQSDLEHKDKGIWRWTPSRRPFAISTKKRSQSRRKQAKDKAAKK